MWKVWLTELGDLEGRIITALSFEPFWAVAHHLFKPTSGVALFLNEQHVINTPRNGLDADRMT